MSRRKQTYSEPSISVYGPLNLEREVSNENQIRRDEDTIIWGTDDALPLRILNAVDLSPTATSCLDRVKDFTQGSGFTDEGLMNLVVDKHGTTLWELHCQISEYLSLLEGFAVNFKYSIDRKITAAYIVGLESCRFKKLDRKSKNIPYIKYNPYFGTQDYNNEFTQTYDVFDINKVQEQIKNENTNYKGQIYFYGVERPLYKFYPVPKYWSAKQWIYVDGQIQEFHKNNLDNGFFSSVLMTMVGDPTAMSNDPSQMKEETGTDNVKRKVPTKTVGQVFDEKMAARFSGVKKAGSVFVRWVKERDQSVDIQPFPVNTNFDILSGTFTDAVRGITIGTKVPAILANLPQQASSLGSDGNSFQKAVELMQSVAEPKQKMLENFYNNILLKNFSEQTNAQVKIKNYSPVTTEVTIEDKFWEFMDDTEKADFINNNVPNVKVKPRIAPVVTTEGGELAEGGNEKLAELGVQKIDRLTKIVTRFNKGKITEEQAKQLLAGYGFTPEQIDAWLVTNGEEETV